MDALVCVVWSLVLLINTPSLKAELSSSTSVPASSGVSPNDAVDLFMTSRTSDPKEPIRMELSRPPSEPQQITDADRPRGASTTSLPNLTPIMTINTASKEPKTDATVRTDAVWTQESITGPKMLTNMTEGSSDLTPPPIPQRSTTITPGSPIPSSTNLSTEHRNSSQTTTSETTPTVHLIPPSIPPSTPEDLITGPASLEKKNQDGPPELDVGDEDSDKVPSPSPLDPLLAGLISIFIISTALLSIILFLKFRQQSGHPEFHRLQDLPMDDLLEDTPLSRYSY